MKTSASKQGTVPGGRINSQEVILMAANNIRYLYNSNSGIGLIYCENSTISYPTHNHVSVLTIGIVLDGSIVLTANSNTSTVFRHIAVIPC